MCGLAIVLSKINRSNDEEVIFAINAISHRGHYTEIETVGNCTLGTRRLPILDRKNGHQPISNESQDIFAILNGEIYNYLDIKKDLQIRGHIFQTSCDTEVLVHLWEEYQHNMVSYLDGMFAFVIYDNKNNNIFAARDCIGIKPLYYYSDGNEYILCSELKGFYPEKRNKVQEIPPQHYFLNGKINKYFFNVFQPYNSSEKNREESLISLLSKSVQKRIATDLPVAVFFSGGIDSAIILELARKFKNNITAITVGFSRADDLLTAIDFCKNRNIKHITKIIDQNDIINNFQKIIYYLESFEPNLVRAAIFTYFMAQTAKENGFSIALSGEGSDELFYGYKDFSSTNNTQADKLGDKLIKDLFRTQLHRLDRCTMAHAVETRVPFLDVNIIDFARKLPVYCKLNGKPYESKTILRKTFHKLVGSSISERPKNPMDEGAIPGGKRKLNQLFNDIIMPVNIPAEKIIKYSLNLNNFKEEAYYLKQFLEHGFDNSISTNRIFVRSH